MIMKYQTHVSENTPNIQFCTEGSENSPVKGDVKRDCCNVGKTLTCCHLTFLF